MNQLLKAYTLFEKDIEYVIMEDKIKLMLSNRAWAKEKLEGDTEYFLNLSKDIQIERQKKDKIIARLIELKFPKLARSIDNPDVSYSYLTDLPLWSLTFEKIEELKKELEDTRRVLDEYKKFNKLVVPDLGRPVIKM